MLIGKNILQSIPKWYLGTSEISNANQLDELGTVFSDDGKCDNHVDICIRKCRQSFYSLNNSGMAYLVQHQMLNVICGIQFVNQF